MLANLYRFRGLILRSAWRGMRLRYAGSALGALWTILLPAAQLVIYTAVFSRVMNPQLAETVDTRFGFVLYLACGVLPWTAFSRAVLHGSGALLANAKFLTKLPVPEEVFVAQAVLEETFNLGVLVALLVLVGLLLGHFPGASFLLLPVVSLLFGLLAFGIGLLLAPFQTFFRDVGYLLGVVLNLWFWTLPLVYVETILSPTLRRLLPWNPPYAFVDAIREIYLYYRVPPVATWLAMAAWVAAFVAFGALVLWRLRPDLRDEL